MVPVFKLVTKARFYQYLPYKDTHPFAVQYCLRILLMSLYAGLGYYIPNLGQMINLQGALTGTLIAFVFPITFYLKVFKGSISE